MATYLRDPRSGGRGPFRRGPFVRRGTLVGSRGAIARGLLTVLGLGGLIGLLVASHYYPRWSVPLALGGFIWFLAVGLLKSLDIWRG